MKGLGKDGRRIPKRIMKDGIRNFWEKRNKIATNTRDC